MLSHSEQSWLKKKKKKIIKNKIKHVNLQNMYDFCLFRTFTETERNRGANAKENQAQIIRIK